MSGFTQDSQGWFIDAAQNDSRDYAIDWVNLLAPGETITTIVWTVDAPLIEVGSASSGSITSVRVTTPSIGSFQVTGKMTSSLGRIINRSFRIIVKSIL